MKLDWLTMKAMMDSIPADCPLELEHIQTHLNSAFHSLNKADREQVLHDLSIVGRMALVMAWILQEEYFPIASHQRPLLEAMKEKEHG